MVVDNWIMIGGNKRQQISNFGKFLMEKHHITLDELDSVVDTDLKTWIDTWWGFDLGLTSAFVSFGLEEEYLKSIR